MLKNTSSLKSYKRLNVWSRNSRFLRCAICKHEFSIEFVNKDNKITTKLKKEISFLSLLLVLLFNKTSLWTMKMPQQGFRWYSQKESWFTELNISLSAFSTLFHWSVWKCFTEDTSKEELMWNEFFQQEVLNKPKGSATSHV